MPILIQTLLFFSELKKKKIIWLWFHLPLFLRVIKDEFFVPYNWRRICTLCGTFLFGKFFYFHSNEHIKCDCVFGCSSTSPSMLTSLTRFFMKQFRSANSDEKNIFIDKCQTLKWGLDGGKKWVQSCCRPKNLVFEICINCSSCCKTFWSMSRVLYFFKFLPLNWIENYF